MSVSIGDGHRTRRYVAFACLLVATHGCTAILGIDGDYKRQSSSVGGGLSSATSSTAKGTGQGGGTSSGGDGGSGGHVSSGPITGSMSRYSIGPQHSTHDQVVTDFTKPGHTIEASVFLPDGTWQSQAGSGMNDGTFEVDGVPDGPFVLNVDGRYTWLTKRTGIDLDIYTTQWASAVPLKNNPLAQFDVTGMTPWVDGDVFELFAPTTGSYVYTDGSPFTPSFGVGATAIDGWANWFSLDTGSGKLISPANTVYLFHLGKFGGNPYTTIVDYKETSITNMVDQTDAPFDITSTFDHVIQDKSFHLQADVAAFTDLLDDFNTGAVSGLITFDYQAIPSSVDVAGQVGSSADLALFYAPQGSPNINRTFFFGNPFEMKGWDPDVYLGVSAQLSVSLPSNAPSASRSYPVSLCDLSPSDTRFDNQMTPDLTPAKLPTADGIPFAISTTPMLDSLTPLLTWSPPATGTPNGWALQPLQVQPDGAGGTLVEPPYKAPVVRVAGNVSQLRVPPGVLTPSTYYLFVLSALSCPDCDYETAPFRTKFPSCQASTISNVLVTPAM